MSASAGSNLNRRDVRLRISAATALLGMVPEPGGMEDDEASSCVGPRERLVFTCRPRRREGVSQDEAVMGRYKVVVS